MASDDGTAVRDFVGGLDRLRARFERQRASGRAPDVADWDELDQLVATLKDYETLADAARTTSARLTAIIEGLPFDFWLIDGDGRYALQNSTCRHHWGDLIGLRPGDSAPSPEVAEIWVDNNRRAFAGEQVKGEVVYTHDGQTEWYYNILSPILDGDRTLGIMGINLDITAEKRLRDEVQRRNKLESLGLLAGGIAHDFNNLLMGIRGMVALAARHLDPVSPPGKLLAKAERGCVNAEALSRRLLTFARGGQPVCTPTTIGPIIEDAVRRATIGTLVACTLDLAADLWWASIDAVQISQAFGNLALNAAQAMPGGGTVKVAARNLPAVDAAALDLGPRDHIEVCIADDGPGIAAEHLPRLFDPYFTTKDGNHGLGLAIVFSVVDKHGGTIRVGSNHGLGTRFDVFLPATPPRDHRAEASPSIDRFSGRLLVVDDDPMVCNAIAEMLTTVGFQVTTAHDSDQAIAAYRASLDGATRFRAVLLDLTLRGGAEGDTCFGALRRLDPAVRAIVISGYATSPILADYARHGYAAALPKPFTIEQLTHALTRTLAVGRRGRT